MNLLSPVQKEESAYCTRRNRNVMVTQRNMLSSSNQEPSGWMKYRAEIKESRVDETHDKMKM